MSSRISFAMSTRPSPTRKEAEKALGRKIPDVVWRNAVEDGWDSDYERAIVSAQEVADFCAAKMEPRNVKGKSTLPARQDDYRISALERIYGLQAAQEPEVQAFRSRILGGKLLRPEDVDSWLRVRLEEDGGPTNYVEVPLSRQESKNLSLTGVPTVADLRAALCSFPAGQLLGARCALLPYLVPGEAFPRCLPVCEGGTTGHLKATAELLSRKYPWTPSQASVFVLTGSAPSIRAVLGASGVSLPSARIPLLEITVHPFAEAEVVAEKLEELRRRVLGLGPRGRVGAVTKKHAELAVFFVEQGEHAGQKQKEVWNSGHEKDWKYSERHQFSRDAHAAYKHVTDWGLTKPKKQGLGNPPSLDA